MREKTGVATIRPSHTALLPHIDLEGTRLTVLAERLGVSKQATSQLVGDMEEMGMVELALARLAEHDVVQLDEERKAAMVSNLLVVLCADRATQPVINVGSLYQ